MSTTTPAQHTAGLGHEAFVSAAFVCLRLAQQDDSDGKRQDRLDQSRAAERAALNALAAAPELAEALHEMEMRLSRIACGELSGMAAKHSAKAGIETARAALAKLNA